MSDPIYVLVQMTITNPAGFRAEYVQPLAAQLTGYDMEILAVSPAPRVVEGSYDRNNTVLLKFASEAEFDRWYGSEGYAPLKTVRAAYSDPSTTLMLVLPAFSGLPS